MMLAPPSLAATIIRHIRALEQQKTSSSVDTARQTTAMVLAATKIQGKLMTAVLTTLAKTPKHHICYLQNAIPIQVASNCTRVILNAVLVMSWRHHEEVGAYLLSKRWIRNCCSPLELFKSNGPLRCRKAPFCICKLIFQTNECVF